MKKITTAIIDDDPRAISRLKELLKHIPETVLMGSFTDAHQGLKAVESDLPKIIFLDIEMPGMDGFEFIERLNLYSASTSIIITSGHDHYAIPAFRKSVFDYLTKPISIVELKNCFSRFKRSKLFNLTEREDEIIKLLCLGLNSREIGEKLFLSKNTIDTYRRRILEKTEVPNTPALVRLFSKRN